jgi:hypothetical protein
LESHLQIIPGIKEIGMAIEVYISHSWRPEHVAVNGLVWDVISKDCQLFVDRDGADTGVYYVNRLEELIRGSEAFVSVLTYRDENAGDGIGPDSELRCSKWALFELRLAERARKPRWVIYDARTGFIPMTTTSDLVLYTAIDGDEDLSRISRAITEDGRRWLASARDLIGASRGRRNNTAAFLLDDQRAGAPEVADTVRRSLRTAGYANAVSIDPGHTDSEVITRLQGAGLLVAEIDGVDLNDIYGMAHALFIPTIRFTRFPVNALPRILNGHPGGYQHDLICEQDIHILGSEITKRAAAMRDRRRPISSSDEGRGYFHSKLYRRHSVFISHNIPHSDRDLLAATIKALSIDGIVAWEYRDRNVSGVDWQKSLSAALSEATDFVFIFGDGFEISPACLEELEYWCANVTKVKSTLPFFWGGRNRPNPKIATLHHESLPENKDGAARILAQRIAGSLRLPVLGR